MKTFIAAHAQHASDYERRCAAYLAAAGYTHLQLVFVLDASGKVLGLRTKPNVPEALCFVDFFSSTVYPAPGRLFYGRLEYSNFQEWQPLRQAEEGASATRELRAVLTGAWAWTKEECELDPISISFSKDGAMMYHSNRAGLFLGDQSTPKEQVVYRVLGETDGVLRTMIEGEDRRTPDGRVVGWDLVLLAEDAFCWHRWDWPAECTPPLISCD